MTKNCHQLTQPTHISFPYSWLGHAPFAMWLICAAQPKKLVELGTHTGNSYLSFCQAVQFYKTQTQCYAIDTWQGDPHAEFYDQQVFQQLKAIHDEPYGQFSTLMKMTFDQAVETFEDNTIDLLHIDGLHTYQAVKHDFKTWLPKLTSNAIVLFHDTCVKERDFGVWQLWQEIEQTYHHTFNFKHSNGLGVICLGEPPAALKPLFQKEENLFAHFTNIGNQLSFHTNLNDLASQIQGYEPQKQALAQLYDTEIHHQNLMRAEYQNLLQILESPLSNQTQLTDNQVRELQQQLSDAQQQLAQQQQLIEQILNARSWRYMAPFRVLAEKLRTIKTSNTLNAIKKLQNKLNHLGLKRTLSKAIRYYRKHGHTAFTQRLRHELKQIKSNAPSYHQWMNEKHLPERYQQANQIMQNWQTSNQSLPKLSIIMPVYDVPYPLLTECIQSVKQQIYPNWELCICNDASPTPGMQDFLEQQALQDPRIKLIAHQTNGHISKASNSALSLATGEYIALLDNDDLLPKDALIWVAQAIIDNPNLQIIYSDEDKIAPNGEYFDPYFKSDWNPELFYAHNMISHLGVYNRALLNKIGGFREGYEGSQDYDLALRCIEQIQPQQIKHLPKTLYHWRVLPGSTAAGHDEKPYANQAALKALNDHIVRTQSSAKIVAQKYGHFRLIHAPLQQQPSVTIIIPTRNAVKLVKTCIQSIQTKTEYQNYTILLIDNGSDDPTAIEYFNQLNQQPNIKVIRDERPFNYSALNNAAVAQAESEFILLLNNDTEVINPQWLTEMVSCGIHQDIGAVGAKLLYPDDRVQHGGVIIGLGGVAGHAYHLLHKDDPGYFGKALVTQQVSAVTAACLLVKKQHYLKVGGLNETQLKVAFNDVDFCLKLQQHGLRNIWTPYAQLYHHESVSRGYEDTPEKQARFASEVQYMQQAWPQIIANDPMYNPNLSLQAPYQYRYMDTQKK